MATHSSVLAWEMPWTEEPDGYSPWGCKESDTTERLTLSLSGSITGAGGRLPLQRSASKKHQLPPRPLGSTQGCIRAPCSGAPAGLRPELVPQPSCPAPLPRAQCTHRACRLLIRPSMSRCPAEYCSMTSFTSYGRSVSLNFLLATRNFRILRGRESQRTFFSSPLSVLCYLVWREATSCLGHRRQPQLGLRPPSLPSLLSCLVFFNTQSLGSPGLGLVSLCWV